MSAALKIDADDKVVYDKFLEHSRALTDSLTKEHFEQVKVPETICWIECTKLNTALTAYELTGDTDYLRRFHTAFENLRSTLKKGEGGFLGWYGSPEASLMDPSKPNAVISEIQTDLRVTTMLSRFLKLLDSEPKLKKEFAADRAAYIDLMENHLVKKWDTSFEDLGSRGAIYRWNKEYKPAKATLTLSHEKLSNMIQGLLGLYMVTGDDELMRKAVKLGVNLKQSLSLANGAYTWRCWDPEGAWDISAEDPTKWRNWIGYEPMAQWYNSTVTSALLLYHYGVVFDRTDVDRFLKAQMAICWNGDLEKPFFFMLNGTAAKSGEIFASPALAPFDGKLAQLLYTGPAHAWRVAKVDSEWHGGVLAGDWLYGKYILDPKVKNGKPLHADKGAKFEKKKANADWLKSLTFEVTEPGYQTPAAPPQVVTPMKAGT